MLSIGPGRYSATIAARSKTDVGWSSRTYRRMPADSSWKMPVVSPQAGGPHAAAPAGGGRAGAVGAVQLGQGGARLEGLVEGNPELVGNGLGDPFDVAVAVAEDTADVADRG